MTARNELLFSADELKQIIERETPCPETSLARTPFPQKATSNGTRVGGVEVVKTACSHNCYDTCGVLAFVKNGRLLKVEGDPDHPITRGTLCVKAYTYPQRIYSEERIKYPLLRTGKRGEGKFTRISWEEAFDHISKKLSKIKQKYGSEALVEYCYSGNREFLAKSISGRFLNLFGASRLVGSF